MLPKFHAARKTFITMEETHLEPALAVNGQQWMGEDELGGRMINGGGDRT